MEIGGYFEIERLEGKELHSGAVRFNYARCCLRYVIRERHITKIYLPYYCCESVINACSGIEVAYYSISEAFEPVFDEKLKEGEFVYLINCFGSLSEEFIEKFVRRYQNVIVDNVQSFYAKPIGGVDTIYSCRKYFGVPDGAYLYTELTGIDLDRQSVLDRMEYLIGREEYGASAYYQKYVTAEERIDACSVKGMSRLTQSIMNAVDYDAVAAKRRENFRFLHESLAAVNQINAKEDEGPYAYPFYTENGGRLRKELISQKIYIPVLWENVLHSVKEDSVESRYVKNILPIPCDQRYGKEEMKRIVDAIMKYNTKKEME